MTTPIDLSGFWQYLINSDLIGLIEALYRYQYGPILFPGVMALALSIPLYLRTQSLTYCAVLWITMCGLVVAFVPVTGQQFMALLIFFVGAGALFGLIDRVRR